MGNLINLIRNDDLIRFFLNDVTKLLKHMNQSSQFTNAITKIMQIKNKTYSNFGIENVFDNCPFYFQAT